MQLFRRTHFFEMMEHLNDENDSSDNSGNRAGEPKLQDRLVGAIRVRGYSLETEKAYVHWYRRFVFFHGKRHPSSMGKVEVEQFLTDLAVEKSVSASTQNQALNAL